MSTNRNKKTAPAAPAAPAVPPINLVVSNADANDDIHNTALGIMGSILVMFKGDNLDKSIKTAIVDKAFDIADVFEKHKGKHRETARLCLIALLVNQHVINLTSQQIKELIEQAFDMAAAFHRS